MILSDAEVGGLRCDVRIEGDRVVDVGPRALRRPGEEMIDARGGALLPGLVDHHIHLLALAAAGTSVHAGPPAVRDSRSLAAALEQAKAGRDGWVRGVGYAESVAGLLDAQALDRLHARRPVRLQHRSGALWMLNSLAIARLGLYSVHHPGIERDETGHPTGRLWRADALLKERLPDDPPDLAEVGARLAGYGITAVTDASPDLGDSTLDLLTRAVSDGRIPQRVHLLGVPSGRKAPEGTTAGPVKIVLADGDLPVLPELTGRIAAEHARGRPIAVHCVTREALVMLIVALRDAGPLPGDRIEHGALIPRELLQDLRMLGVRVVTQPGFIADRGDDYLTDVPEEDQRDLYRYASLLRAGIPVAPSSDAPYGPADPWQVIRAARDRHTARGRLLSAAERVTAKQALAGYLTSPEDPGGRPRSVRPGVQADLLLLDRPLERALAAPSAEYVRLVIRWGRVVFDRDGLLAPGGTGG